MLHSAQLRLPDVIRELKLLTQLRWVVGSVGWRILVRRWLLLLLLLLLLRSQRGLGSEGVVVVDVDVVNTILLTDMFKHLLVYLAEVVGVEGMVVGWTRLDVSCLCVNVLDGQNIPCMPFPFGPCEGRVTRPLSRSPSISRFLFRPESE